MHDVVGMMSFGIMPFLQRRAPSYSTHDDGACWGELRGPSPFSPEGLLKSPLLAPIFTLLTGTGSVVRISISWWWWPPFVPATPGPEPS